MMLAEKQITFGSKIELWEIEDKENIYSVNVLEAKLCATIDGIIPSATSPLFSLCSKYNEKQREDSLKSQTKQTNVYIGGTETTRDAFIESGNTKENISNFIKSSNQSNQAISYGFTPIWEVIQSIENLKCIEKINDGEIKSLECDNIQRCLNLEASFGYQASLCDKKVTADGIVYQEFVEEKSGVLKSYKCWNKKEGCNKDTDCNLTFGGCKAYGSSALEKGAFLGQNEFKTKIRGHVNKDSSYNGINNSCNFNLLSGGCKCNDRWIGNLNDRYVWDQTHN